MKIKSTKKNEKNYILIFLFSISFYLCDAQMLNSRQGRLETIKMSYITKKLNLSDKEAQNFWVIYPQYLKDLSTVKHSCPGDEVRIEENIVSIRKRYRNKMLPILKSRARVDQVFTLEKNYREILRKELKKRITADSSN